MTPRHITETSAYWESLAASERAFAKDRSQTAESVRIHRENAAEYQYRADILKARGK